MRIDREAIARRMQQIMSDARLTQEDFAIQLRVSQPAISMYLKGRMPPADVLLRAADVGNTSVEWILTGRESFLTTPSRLRETKPSYGSEAALLSLWERLPVNLKRDLLTLMRHLLELQE